MRNKPHSDPFRLVLAAALAIGACRAGHVSWPRPTDTVPASHAQVKTVNSADPRTSSQVVVRAVERPTRAALDWAAYHANFMNAEPPPEGDEGGGKGDA